MAYSRQQNREQDVSERDPRSDVDARGPRLEQRYGNSAATARLSASPSERGQGEIDRRTPPSLGRSDGSGEWGQEDAGITDYANREFWYQVANMAEALDLTNAARHMRHYLDNTGATLDVDVNVCLRDSQALELRFEDEIATAKVDAETMMQGKDMAKANSFSLVGQKKNHYFQKSENEDWFFAIGGCTYWYTADVVYTPGDANAPGTLDMTIKLHLFDNYNWDQGKAVTIAGITVRDEQLGRLHKVGLAKEYSITGESSERSLSWNHGTAAGPGEEEPYEPGRGDQASGREDGRSDPVRERQ